MNVAIFLTLRPITSPFMKKSGRLIHRVVFTILVIISFTALVPILLALTPLPFYLHQQLGTSKSGLEIKPQVIILLGGGGMPSESNLIRAWYAARLGNHYQDADLIIALPSDLSNQESSAQQIKNELIIRGIQEERIQFEPIGTNTRSQALRLFEMTGGSLPAAVVTSPEHMKRSLLTLKKVGFDELWGVPAFENPNDVPLEFADENLGGNQAGIPRIGRKLGIRYHFWTQLHYERLVVREYLALIYYKLKGWL